MATGRDASRSPRRGPSVAKEACSLGFSFRGKRALITGGSKGIGLATAKLLCELGAEVIISARGVEDLQKAKASMCAPERCHIHPADLSTTEGIQALASSLPFENLHVLVNNVGINIRKRAEDFTSEEFEKIFDSNFFSAFRLSTALLPHLRRGGEEGGAAIVNISSVAGLTHIPSGAAYGASKAAMDQMTRNLAVEWARFGIRVNSVAPGPTVTPLMDNANPRFLQGFVERIPMRRLGKVEDVCRPIVFLASDASSWITGQVLAVDGGFTASSYCEVPGFWEMEEKEKDKEK